MGLNHGEGVCLPKAAASADGVNEDRGYLGLKKHKGIHSTLSPPVIEKMKGEGRSSHPLLKKVASIDDHTRALGWMLYVPEPCTLVTKRTYLLQELD